MKLFEQICPPNHVNCCKVGSNLIRGQWTIRMTSTTHKSSLSANLMINNLEVNNIVSNEANSLKDEIYLIKGKTFKFLSLREQFSLPLLTKIYDEIMKPNFPIESELDPLEVWIRNLTHKGKQPFVPVMHINVCFEAVPNQIGNEPHFDNIAGISVFEYYEMSQCGLLTYFVVCEKYRSFGIGKTLVYQAYNYSKNELYMKGKSSRWESLNNALSCVRSWNGGGETTIVQLTKAQMGQLHFAQKFLEIYSQYMSLKEQHADLKPILDVEEDEFYFFAETNAIGVHDGVMPSEQRHKVMRNIGFCCIDFDYIQPPVTDDDDALFCDDLLLLSLEIDGDSRTKSDSELRAVPVFKIKCWLLELIYTVYREDVRKAMFDDYFQYMMKDADKRGIRIKMYRDPVAWNRRTQFQVKTGEGHHHDLHVHHNNGEHKLSKL
ncbi:hypothetical protein ABK040_005101 [Willaertia magna]